MEENEKNFVYTYSAKEQEEIKRIRQKYLRQDENKMEQLRKLDESATKKGTVVSLAVGTLSALVLGIGMCCTMVWADELFIPGVGIGIVGIAGIGASYPLYRVITKKQREKLAPKIMELTNELMK
ncbi:hypothetical protein [Clostridium transplantifaecale]|uniref:hypothetical protein n=1 Tax=Clostridium transplantifaecale TaxID=2479838 RepID=UPI000F6319D5|nr:hypothetical protein [Clostridium transplantifaecale]